MCSPALFILGAALSNLVKEVSQQLPIYTLSEILGVPDEDNEWQFSLIDAGEPAIFHQRVDDEIYYYTYDSTNFQLAEEGVRYIAQ